MSKRRICISIPPDVWEDAKELARESGLSLSALISMLLARETRKPRTVLGDGRG